MKKELDEFNHYKMNELIDKIEENQQEQNQIIELKTHENQKLVEENEKLKELLKESNEIILMLNNEIKNLSELLANDKKNKVDVEEKIKLLYSILEVSKKIDLQKQEIEIIDLINTKSKTS